MSRLRNLAARANPFDSTNRRNSGALQPLAGSGSPISTDRPSLDNRSPSPNYSDPFTSTHGHSNNDDLAPPQRPFGGLGGIGSERSKDSSRRSSFSSSKGARPPSLSVNYVPAKFTRLHEPGEYAHRRKIGGGRDAFASNADRMGQMGTVDDDEGIAFQLGKGGLKAKKPKLRWNRFKWALFAANTLLIAYGIAMLVCAILVWLNVFYQSDVIRVGNRTELIISTVASALIVLTSLIGFSGIILNVRAFLAVYTLLLWVCFGLMVAPGYMAYKRKTFNLEGKINLQWSRNLGTQGRLRIQDALRCCGYFSPYVEAVQSPLCYPRSNFPGCKNKYLKLERHVLTTWYTIAFSLVPAHLLIIVTALLCSNHVTYRFGKGLTPKLYRLDLGAMAVIMDEYASQIAAQYGPGIANEVLNRSTPNLNEVTRSRHGSASNLTAMGVNTNGSATPTRPTSRFVNSTTGSNSAVRGSALFDPSRDSFDGTRNTFFETEADRGDSTRYADSEDDWGGRTSGYNAYAQPGQAR